MVEPPWLTRHGIDPTKRSDHRVTRTSTITDGIVRSVTTHRSKIRLLCDPNPPNLRRHSSKAYVALQNRLALIDEHGLVGRHFGES